MKKDLQTLSASAFKYFNRLFMVPLWRLGFGKILNMGPTAFGRYMVLVHHGRKTGKTYYTPVNFAEIGGDIYCTAGYGGKSDWFRNITADPKLEIWLPNGWYTALAEDISEEDSRVAIMRQVLVASGFASQMFGGVDPGTMTNQEVDALTQGYRLVRIRRIGERTGEGGPGEYAWIWPIATTVMFFLYLTKPSARKPRQ